jgi:hypothetical protein
MKVYKISQGELQCPKKCPLGLTITESKGA